METNLITERIIGAAIEVHRELGPGLLESVYEECMTLELAARHLSFERQVPVAITYKRVPLENSYRVDLVIERKVIVELKSVASLDQIHAAQVLTYLKLTGCSIGLIINFNVRLLKDGVRRLILSSHSAPSAALR